MKKINPPSPLFSIFSLPKAGKGGMGGFANRLDPHSSPPPCLPAGRHPGEGNSFGIGGIRLTPNA
jgi:hypothetical protein